jgi:hypothetical protein
MRSIPMDSLQCLTANVTVATVLGLIQESSDTLANETVLNKLQEI